MKLRIKFAVVFPILISFTNCAENTTTGNPGPVTLSIQGTKPGALSASGLGALAQTTITLKDSSGAAVGSLTITDARVALKEIEFETDNTGASDDSDDIDLPGPFVADLLTDTVTPSLASITLPAGTYKEIELKLDKIQGDEEDDDGNSIVGSSDPLFNNSIYVEGTYTGPTANGGAGGTPGNVTDMPFTMSFDLDEEFELTGPNDTSNGVDIGDGTNSIIIAFRLAKWFSFDNAETNSDGVEPSQLVVSGGAIALDENATGDNEKIRDIIKDNIKESADYGKDEDGDGKLQESEDDDPDAEDDDD